MEQRRSESMTEQCSIRMNVSSQASALRSNRWNSAVSKPMIEQCSIRINVSAHFIKNRVQERKRAVEGSWMWLGRVWEPPQACLWWKELWNWGNRRWLLRERCACFPKRSTETWLYFYKFEQLIFATKHTVWEKDLNYICYLISGSMHNVIQSDKSNSFQYTLFSMILTMPQCVPVLPASLEPGRL